MWAWNHAGSTWMNIKLRFVDDDEEKAEVDSPEALVMAADEAEFEARQARERADAARAAARTDPAVETDAPSTDSIAVPPQQPQATRRTGRGSSTSTGRKPQRPQ